MHIKLKTAVSDLGAALLSRQPSQEKLDATLQIAAKYATSSTELDVLLGGGAGLEACNASGQTPLHIAVNSGNALAIAALLTAGANPHHCDNDGFTVFHLITGSESPSSFTRLAQKIEESQQEKLYNILYSLGLAEEKEPETLTIDRAAKNGLTPLHWASQQLDAKTTYALIRAGADITKTTSTGKTALHLVCTRGILHPEPLATVIREYRLDTLYTLLQEAPALLHLTDNKGWTALHYAAQNGNSEELQALVDAGAKANFSEEGRETAIQVALQFHKQRAALLLGLTMKNVEAQAWADSGKPIPQLLLSNPLFQGKFQAEVPSDTYTLTPFFSLKRSAQDLKASDTPEKTLTCLPCHRPR